MVVGMDWRNVAAVHDRRWLPKRVRSIGDEKEEASRDSIATTLIERRYMRFMGYDAVE
jgi:hypothetical protein